jgi:hypothetical protein
MLEPDVNCFFESDAYEVIVKLEKVVTPAKAGVQKSMKRLDSRFRGNDILGVLQLTPIHKISGSKTSKEHLVKCQQDLKHDKDHNIPLHAKRTFVPENIEKLLCCLCNKT